MYSKFFDGQFFPVPAKRFAGCVVLLASMTLGACASLPLAQVDGQLRQGLPKELAAAATWRRGPQADALVASRVKELATTGVSQDMAVQIALLANPDLQIQLERLGLERATWLAASQIANPVLGWSRRNLRDGAGANVEYSVAQDLLGILSLPGRRKAANSAWQAARFEAVASVLHLALAVRQQYLRANTAAYINTQARQSAEIGQLMFELAERYQAAGNMSVMEREQQRDKAVAARAAAARATANATEQREQLLRLMGINGQHDDLKLTDAAMELPRDDPQLAALETMALQQRVDLQAARKQVEARLLSLRNTAAWRFLAPLELHASTERDPGGARVTGPGVSIGLPLFNAQQAALAASDSNARLALRHAEALALDVRRQLRTAHAQMLAARAIAKAWRSEALPAREAIVESAEREYFYMLKGPWDPLQAQQELLTARIGAAESVSDYWIARIAVAEAAGDLSIAAASVLPAEQEKTP